MLEIRNWREQHPGATLTEIEAAVDGLWAKVRARLIQEAALAGEAEDIGQQGEDSVAPGVPSVGADWRAGERRYAS